MVTKVRDPARGPGCDVKRRLPRHSSSHPVSDAPAASRWQSIVSSLLLLLWILFLAWIALASR